MDPLLFSMALLMGVSGAVKARSSARLGLGSPVGALVELVAAVGLAFVAVSAGAGTRIGPWLAVGGLILTLGSSVRHASRMREHRRRRDATEERRLEAYLRIRTSGGGDHGRG
jgi:hypothetical protein